MNELPRDIQKMIIRKMDIDTRRLLGIYRRMTIPPLIKEKLNKHIKSYSKSIVFDTYKEGFVAYKFVGLNDIILQRHWHNQDIHPKYILTKEVLSDTYRLTIKTFGLDTVISSRDITP